MKLAKTLLLNSTRAQSSICGFVQFVALGTMSGNIARLPAAEKMADRSKPAQTLVNKMMTAREIYWSVTQHMGDSFDQVHDLEAACDKAVITRPVAIKPEEMAALAEATGLSVQEVTAKRQLVIAKAMNGETERAKALRLFIEEGEFAEPMNWEDVEVDATKAHGKVVEVASWIATWSKPDYAELVLLKRDRILAEQWALQEQASEEGAGGMDEQPAAHVDSATRKETLAAMLKAADQDH